MNKKCWLVVVSVLAMLLVGCSDSVPVSPKPADGSNPNVSGTPEERIKRIEADGTLSPEERTRRINLVKSRNNLK